MARRIARPFPRPGSEITRAPASVAIDNARIFVLQIKRLLRAAENDVKRLLIERIQALNQPAAVDFSTNVVDPLQQLASRIQSQFLNGERHIAASFACRIKRSERCPQKRRAIGINPAETNVCRDSRLRMVCAANSRHDRSNPRSTGYGTVVGKALESMNSGTGLISVLVMPR